MINSIKVHTTYRRGSTIYYLVETDEESIDKITDVVSNENYENIILDGVRIKDYYGTTSTPRINSIIMYGRLDEITGEQVKKVIPMTLIDTDKPKWVTDAIAVDGKWVGDVHPETGMPMMYQSYRTPDKEFKDLCKRVKSNNVIILKSSNV